MKEEIAAQTREIREAVTKTVKGSIHKTLTTIDMAGNYLIFGLNITSLCLTAYIWNARTNWEIKPLHLDKSYILCKKENILRTVEQYTLLT